MITDKTAECFAIEPWRPSHKRAVEICEHLVVHRNAAGQDAITLAEFFRDEGHKWTGSKRMSYHFVIDKQGCVEQAVPLTITTPGAKGRNNNGIHICVVGDFRDKAPTKEQLSSLVILLDVLTDVLPRLKIQRHDGQDPCPGNLLPLEFLVTEVKRKRAAKAAARARLHGVRF